MQIKNLEDAFFWWLEELPVDELQCDRAQEIVSCYRSGLMDVTEASVALEQDCKQSIDNWIETNKELDSLFPNGN